MSILDHVCATRNLARKSEVRLKMRLLYRFLFQRESIRSTRGESYCTASQGFDRLFAMLFYC